MKINSAKNRLTRKILLLSILPFAIITGALTYAYVFDGSIFGWPNRTEKTISINYDKPTEPQKDQGISAKESFNDKHYPNQSTDETAGTPDAATRKDVGIVITSASQQSDSLQIRTMIQTINSGNCKLTMTKDSSTTLTRTAETQNLGSYSTCKGFDIPLPELTRGTWQIVVDFANENEIGSTNQKVEVQ